MTGEQVVSLPSPLQDLSVFIDTQPERLAYESSELRELALRAAKYVFDWAVQTESTSRPHVESLLNTLTDVEPPQTRSAAKRKSSHTLPAEPRKKKNKVPPLETPIPSLFVDRMSMEQIWEQLDLRGARELGRDEDENEDEQSEFEEEESDDEEEDSDLEESEDDHEEDDSSLPGEEDVAALQEESSDEEEDEEDDRPSTMLDVIRKKPTASKAGAHPELDDGFFNLQEFNAEIEQAEAKSVSKGRLHRDTDSEDSGTETDVDLFEAVDEAMDEEEDLEENYFYRDFFDAPRSSKSPRTARYIQTIKGPVSRRSQGQENKSKREGTPVSTMMYEEDDEDDEDFVLEDDDADDQDVFEESSDDDEEEDEDGDEDEDEDENEEEEEGKEKGTRKKEKLREQRMRMKDDLFAEDEEQQKARAENVAKKDWVLMGEASSKSRPRDSLLQEDLEFDRIAKSVPIVTEEVVAGLEERIKARIKEGRFDDVVRRRPLDDKPFLPSRLFELQDTKSQQSLAQIYENEYMAAQAGGSTDDRDAKLKKEHEAITKLWEGICNKLDALCNAHYVPKQSALPTNKSVSSTLAPEEIFAPTSSDPRVRSELTPAEKRALRTKQRKARKKERDLLEKSVDKFAKKKKGVKEQKDAALKSLVKSGKGVTVVGKEAKKAKMASKRKS
ncbi:Mpp10 protein-domain-containing protein [Pisolithus albus]|nr:Mpp10 protein-domain-containing protein [Pisolithus albus]